MDNQHRRIAGYRELGEFEIGWMNRVKENGPDLEELVAQMEGNEAFDQRWVAVGKTHLQQGLMALTRAVARPDFF